MKKLDIDEFLISTSVYIETAGDGDIHIIGDEARWGKISFRDSEIVSLVYADLPGVPALSEMGKLNQIRVLYRPVSVQSDTSESEENRNKKLFVKASISTEEFFSFFEQKYPDAVSKCINTLKTKTLVDDLLNQTIMVIDDSAISRKMISRPLIEGGYSIIEANDGFDGLGKIQKHTPDLVIIDLIMPGIDGYKVVELLKKSEEYKDLPIIIVTSKDSLVDKIRGKMSTTDAYITKPFKDADLLDIIKKLLH